MYANIQMSVCGENMNCPRCKQPMGETETKWCQKCKNKRRDQVRIRREYFYKFVQLYLEKHPCSCGVTDPDMLTFDHIHGKSFEIGRFISNKYTSKENIKELWAEMKKCAVKCWNCHMKEEKQKRNWRNK
jgi:hypothetical protein